jgi:F-type H+-transporting ATPase subunit delta
VAIFDMHQTSISSLHEVGVKFGADLSKLTEKQAASVSHQFFAFAEAIAQSVSLQRSLTDSGRPLSVKTKMVKDLGSSIKAEDVVIKVVSSLSDQKWSQPYDFFASVCEFGFNCSIISLSKRTGKKEGIDHLKMVEDELFGLIRELKDVSSSNPDLSLLRDYLSSSYKPLDARFIIVEDLVKGKVDPITLLLAKMAVLCVQGGRYVTSLQRISDEIANLRGKKVVQVCSTVQPTSDQLTRLEGLLEEKYQEKVQINVVIDPNILGGMRIRVDADMFDSTIINSFKRFSTELSTTIGN